MNNLLVSFFGGFISTFVALIICAFLIIGIKYFLSVLKDLFSTKKNLKEIPKVTKQKRVYKPIKTIEIDPNEVDRIVVKR